jgi:hypothetical protein
MMTQTESLRFSSADSGLAAVLKGFELGAIIGGSAIVLLAIVAAVYLLSRRRDHSYSYDEESGDSNSPEHEANNFMRSWTSTIDYLNPTEMQNREDFWRLSDDFSSHSGSKDEPKALAQNLNPILE